jgi:transposase
MDLEQTLRGLLRGFGLKVGDVSRGKLPARIRGLAAGHAMLERIVEPLLAAREAMWREFAKLHREVLAIVKEDQVCRRLMTVPGVGAVVSLTYRAAVDDPDRFKKSKAVGAFFGLTPKRYQSGETDVTGGITRVGDASVRSALHDAANVLLSRVARFSALKRWAMEVAKRRGMRRAKVALARKLATVLHRIWADGTEFRWGKDPAAATAAA